MATNNWRSTSALDHALPSPRQTRPRGRFGSIAGLIAVASLGVVLGTAIGELRVRNYAQNVESAFGEEKQRTEELHGRIRELSMSVERLNRQISSLTNEKHALSDIHAAALRASANEQSRLTRRIEDLKQELETCRATVKDRDKDRDKDKGRTKDKKGQDEDEKNAASGNKPW